MSTLQLHNPDAERTVLGCQLKDGGIAAEHADLSPDCFFLETHQHIQSAIQHLISERSPVDLITVGNELQERGWLKKIGGMPYLADLIDSIGTTIGHEKYVAILKEYAERRRLIDAAAQIGAKGRQQEVTLDELRSLASSSFLGVIRGGDKGGLKSYDSVVAKALGDIGDRKEGKVAPGLSTGLRAVDADSGPLLLPSYNIVAGRPGMGKTAFFMGVAEHVASLGHRVAVFELEMDANRLGERRLVSGANGDLKRVIQEAKSLSEDEVRSLTDAATRISTLPIWIDDTPGVTVEYIASSCRRLVAREGPLSLVVVDYIQLMRPPKADNREQQLSQISKGLLALAKEMGAAMLVLSQLNRSCESRNDKRPMLSDLRESGSLEQDADRVVFLYRDEYYDPKTEEPGVAEIITAKNRHGQPNVTTKVKWNGKQTSFTDLGEVIVERAMEEIEQGNPDDVPIQVQRWIRNAIIGQCAFVTFKHPGIAESAAKQMKVLLEKRGLKARHLDLAKAPTHDSNSWMWDKSKAMAYVVSGVNRLRSPQQIWAFTDMLHASDDRLVIVVGSPLSEISGERAENLKTALQERLTEGGLFEC